MQGPGYCTHARARILYTWKDPDTVHMQGPGYSTHARTRIQYTGKGPDTVHMQGPGYCTHARIRIMVRKRQNKLISRVSKVSSLVGFPFLSSKKLFKTELFQVSKRFSKRFKLFWTLIELRYYWTLGGEFKLVIWDVKFSHPSSIQHCIFELYVFDA